MIFHSETREAVIRELSSDQSYGLDPQQIQEKRSVYGENKLREKKKKTNLQRFLDQFKDVMILILLAAAAISFGIACVEGDPKEFFEPVLILLIVILNAIMGVKVRQKRRWML
ncbi:MAG: cation-transporting P-type ATPase [Fusicatenibacter sp.]|nr:cation-transporting P-type ATPase [Fusicatenibacter sp.]